MKFEIEPIKSVLMKSDSNSQEIAFVCELLTDFTATQWTDLFTALDNESADAIRNGSARACEAVLRMFLAWGYEQLRMTPEGCPIDAPLRHGMCGFYRVLRGLTLPRHHLLMVLAMAQEDACRDDLTTLLLEDPPTGSMEAAAPLMPLFRSPKPSTARLFPRLLEGLENVELAPAILDLANFLTRERVVDQHPALGRSNQLIRLLEGLIDGLTRLEHQAFASSAETFDEAKKNLENFSNSALDPSEKANDSLLLAFALCDALGAIGDRAAIPTLERATELSHRRLRVEAWTALGRLGMERGINELAKMAAHPAVRLRVLAYAEEMQWMERIDEPWRSPEAIAEAELVAYLAQPTVFGVAPSGCELVDTRTLYWPGYDEPRVCYLFRFTYQIMHPDTEKRAEYANYGLAGPAVQAFQADLTHLAFDDVYAVFAGWTAEHEELVETNFDQLSPREFQIADERLRELEDADYEAIEPIGMLDFFGDLVFWAVAQSQGAPGIAIVEVGDTIWKPYAPGEAGSAVPLIKNWYKGRRLLLAFNDDLAGT
ncbi:MAG: HEAT repeat domain-containing protein [Planctomycetales bacterium]|nr:HEAT repeat domain-containing protein [Planctomycetales bacterium]